MAEEPDTDKLEHDFPVLRQLVHTVGQPYTAEQLASLQAYVQQFMQVPRISKGIEAFIEFEPCQPLDFFINWHVMRCEVKSPEETKIRPYNVEGSYYWVDAFNFDALRILDDIAFSSDVYQQLQNVGRRLGISDSPRTFFLWENSD